MKFNKPRSNEISQSIRKADDRSLCMTDEQSNGSSDQEAIAVWVSDFSKLAESLWVRPATSAWPPLTVRFQGNYPNPITRSTFPRFLDNIITGTRAIFSNGSRTPMSRSPSDPHLSLDQTPQPSTVHPIPGPSTLVEVEVSPCIRLATRACSPHELTSLIDNTLNRKNEVKMIGCLDRDAAQTFIDVVHEVRFVVLHICGAARSPPSSSVSPLSNFNLSPIRS